MRVSIDIGNDPQTIATVTEFLRKIEAFIAVTIDERLEEMPCKDDNGNIGYALMPVPIEGFNYQEENNKNEKD